jgi:hypothetical protein
MLRARKLDKMRERRALMQQQQQQQQEQHQDFRYRTQRVLTQQYGGCS